MVHAILNGQIVITQPARKGYAGGQRAPDQPVAAILKTSRSEADDQPGIWAVNRRMTSSKRQGDPKMAGRTHNPAVLEGMPGMGPARMTYGATDDLGTKSSRHKVASTTGTHDLHLLGLSTHTGLRRHVSREKCLTVRGASVKKFCCADVRALSRRTA